MKATLNGEYAIEGDNILFFGTSERGDRHVHLVPIQAIATRMELLGYDDPADALAVILGPETEQPAENPWTEVYERVLTKAPVIDIRAAQGRARAKLGAPAPSGRATNALLAHLPKARIARAQSIGETMRGQANVGPPVVQATADEVAELVRGPLASRVEAHRQAWMEELGKSRRTIQPPPNETEMPVTDPERVKIVKDVSVVGRLKSY